MTKIGAIPIIGIAAKKFPIGSNPSSRNLNLSTIRAIKKAEPHPIIYPVSAPFIAVCIKSSQTLTKAAGFSIITWTGDGQSNATVGTGLSSDKPLSWVIVKKTSTSSDWQVGHRGSGNLSNFAYHYNLNDASDVDGSSPYHMGSQSATNGDRLYLAGDGAANTVSYLSLIHI